MPTNPARARAGGVCVAGAILLCAGARTASSAPPNDAFESAALLSGLPASATGTNVGATRQAGEPRHGGDVGGASVWWSWTPPAAAAGARVAVTTAGSSADGAPDTLDTLLGVYEGSVLGTLVPVAEDDDQGSGLTSRVLFTVKAGTSYKIAVDGFSGGSAPSTGTIRLAILPRTGRDFDFDADGRADLLWREPASGETYLWSMNGTAVKDGQYIGGGRATPDWTLEAIGDFDGDGRSDMLWRHRASGWTYIWMMDGATVVRSGYTASYASPDWHVAGVGDFDGDGKTDILWRHDDGTPYLWMMDGLATPRQGYVQGAASPDWNVAGVGDFDGDGKADILWRHPTGYTRIWLMNGLQQVANRSTAAEASASWSVEAVGDLDGDGRADIVWGRPDAPGSPVRRYFLWLMRGTSLKGSLHLGKVALPWRVLGAFDLDGDGRADLLWRDVQQGATYVWQMDGGFTLPGSGYTAAQASTAWQVEMP